MSDIKLTATTYITIPENVIAGFYNNETGEDFGPDDGSDEWYRGAVKSAIEMCEDGPWVYGDYATNEEIEEW